MIKDTIYKLIDELILEMLRKKISKKDLAEKIGLSRATILNAFDKKNINIDTLDKIERGIKEWNS